MSIYMLHFLSLSYPTAIVATKSLVRKRGVCKVQGRSGYEERPVLSTGSWRSLSKIVWVGSSLCLRLSFGSNGKSKEGQGFLSAWGKRAREAAKSQPAMVPRKETPGKSQRRVSLDETYFVLLVEKRAWSCAIAEIPAGELHARTDARPPRLRSSHVAESPLRPVLPGSWMVPAVISKVCS